MPRAKTKASATTTSKTKKAVKSTKKTTSQSNENTQRIPLSIAPLQERAREFSTRVRNYRPTKTDALILAGLGLLVVLYLNKGLLVTATVNGQPITTLELNQRLNSLYKEQTLNQMINEKILEQEAKKKSITISDQQVQQKIEETSQQYGGMENFEGLLSQQGLSLDDFKKQLRYQLIVEELYKDEIKPTEDEINKFMEENKEIPEATDAAEFKELAESQVRQEKLTNTFSQKFQELRKNADVKQF